METSEKKPKTKGEIRKETYERMESHMDRKKNPTKDKSGSGYFSKLVDWNNKEWPDTIILQSNEITANNLFFLDPEIQRQWIKNHSEYICNEMTNGNWRHYKVPIIIANLRTKDSNQLSVLDGQQSGTAAIEAGRPVLVVVWKGLSRNEEVDLFVSKNSTVPVVGDLFVDRLAQSHKSLGRFYKMLDQKFPFWRSYTKRPSLSRMTWLACCEVAMGKCPTKTYRKAKSIIDNVDKCGFKKITDYLFSIFDIMNEAYPFDEEYVDKHAQKLGYTNYWTYQEAMLAAVYVAMQFHMKFGNTKETFKKLIDIFSDEVLWGNAIAFGNDPNQSWSGRRHHYIAAYVLNSWNRNLVGGRMKKHDDQINLPSSFRKYLKTDRRGKDKKPSNFFLRFDAEMPYSDDFM